MLRKYFFLIISLMLFSNLMAKNNNEEDIAEIDSLLTLSRNNKFGIDIESAIEYAYKALLKSDKIDYSEGIVKSNLYLAQSLFNLGNYEESLEYLSLAENEEYTSEDPVILFEISSLRGQIFSYLNIKNKSIKEFQKCLAYTLKIKSVEERDYGLSLTYENLSVVYNSIDKQDSALYFMNKNRELLESKDESAVFNNMINLYTSYGRIYFQGGDFDLAQQNFDKALRLAEEYQFPYQSRTFRFLGDIMFSKGNIDSALIYYNKALDNLRITKLTNEYALVYKQIAELYKKTGNVDSAMFYTEKMSLIEEKLSISKQNSVEQALQVFINEEKSIQAKERRRLLTVIFASAIALVLIVLLVSRAYRKRKEEESLLLQNKLNDSLKKIKVKEEKAKVLEQKLNESFDEVVELAKSNDPSFLRRFQEVYADQSKRILQKHPDLSNSEFTLCAMIYLNFSSKEIASYTFVEHRTVQTKKSRLRKKLNLDPGYSLENYFQSFD